jgi:hypothetical protein
MVTYAPESGFGDARRCSDGRPWREVGGSLMRAATTENGS